MRTVAGGVLLPRDQRLGVEETPVWAIPDLVNDIGLEVNVQRTGHVFARGSLREKGAEAMVVGASGAFNETTVRLKERSALDNQKSLSDAR